MLNIQQQNKTICFIRGEGKIEKVFVLDFHRFIRKIEDFVG